MLDRLLVSGGMDGKLALWDTRPELAAGAQQQALQGQTEPTAEASPGGVVSPLYEIDLGVGPSPSTPAPLLQAPGGVETVGWNRRECVSPSALPWEP
jgi:hypothetical protein